MNIQIISKFQGLEFLNKKSSKGILKKKKIGNLVIFIRIKIYSSKCKTHVKEIIMQKKTFGCSSKLILTFSKKNLINQIINAQLCMHVKNHHRHMNYRLYLGLFNFSHSNLFHVNDICKK
jgi:hypothetical protein